MAKRHMYIRFEYESLWVNNHGAAVEIDPDTVESMVKQQLECLYPLNKCHSKAQITLHEKSSTDSHREVGPRNCG